MAQSHHEVVTILPALPAGWPSGNARGLCVRRRGWCRTPSLGHQTFGPPGSVDAFAKRYLIVNMSVPPRPVGRRSGRTSCPAMDASRTGTVSPR
jgi:hypothetical protein